MRFSRIEGRHVSSPKSGFIPLSMPLSRLRFEIGPFGRIWPKQTFLIRFYPNLRCSADSSSCRASFLFQKKTSIHSPVTVLNGNRAFFISAGSAEPSWKRRISRWKKKLSWSTACVTMLTVLAAAGAVTFGRTGKRAASSKRRIVTIWRKHPNGSLPCEGCCYGPCVSFCMKKILGYKGEEVPASVR